MDNDSKFDNAFKIKVEKVVSEYKLMKNHNKKIQTTKNYKESIKEFDKAIKLNRNDYLAHNNKGKYQIVWKNVLHSIKFYYLQLNKIGAVYSKLKKYQKAIDSFNKSIKLNPTSANSFNGKGNAL